SIKFPEPVISIAVEPRTKIDQDKLDNALVRLAEEDPTFKVRTDEETGQVLISGMGELHLEVILDRMFREYKVEANRGRPQAGYPVIDVRATLVDGSYHEVDSNELAFEIAGSLALQEALEKGKTAILEPIMRIEVVTPEQFMGDVIGDLNSRRGHIESTEIKA